MGAGIKRCPVRNAGPAGFQAENRRAEKTRAAKSQGQAIRPGADPWLQGPFAEAGNKN